MSKKCVWLDVTADFSLLKMVAKSERHILASYKNNNKLHLQKHTQNPSTMDSQDKALHALLTIAETMGVKIDPKVLKLSMNLCDQGVDPLVLAVSAFPSSSHGHNTDPYRKR